MRLYKSSVWVGSFTADRLRINELGLQRQIRSSFPTRHTALSKLLTYLYVGFLSI